MSRTVAFALVIGLAIAVTAPAQQPPPSEQVSILIRDFGDVPRSVTKLDLLRMGPVFYELKLTDGQRRAVAQSQASDRFRRKIRAAREIGPADKRADAVHAVNEEMEADAIAVLEPRQRERLEQIRLQLLGPIAFLRPEIRERLGLSAEQIRAIGPIVTEGQAAITRASAVPLPVGLTLDEVAASLNDVRENAQTPEFREATAAARRNAREAWKATTRKIGRVLTDDQRETFEAMLGPTFDASALREGVVARAEVAPIAPNPAPAGQRVDLGFDAKVAHPAYTAAHPKVLFDEAHHNFHTSRGRYKPLADLLASDGYTIVPNQDKFTPEALARADVLLVANALGGEGLRNPYAGQPAFTDDECDAVRDWVRGGGSLLLVTDRPPMGSPSAGLAKRFGVSISAGAAADPVNSLNGPEQLVFSRENELIGDHPITRGRDDSEPVSRVMTFSGQTIWGGDGARAFLVLSPTATDAGGPGGEKAPASGRSQGLALRYGKGRVVVLGEAGLLSAQVLGPGRAPMGMNVPGVDNRQLALNILHWLSGLIDSERGRE